MCVLNGKTDYKTAMKLEEAKDVRVIARKITNAENGVLIMTIKNREQKQYQCWVLPEQAEQVKSSVTDEIVRRFLNNFTE
ncbi:MAG: hypothetical protein V9F01_09455 [Chitinophagaceae bacterium]